MRGYLDHRQPHAVNSLIVQRLGTEEVVAVVRDDGDVDAFLVRHVVQAIERREEKGSSLGVQADEIRPIFQDNVGISAWGLAIHSEARILATSSNNHEVRVFKFGLLQDRDESSDSEIGDDGHDALESGGDRKRSSPRTSSRTQDVRLHVINGNSNIPSIAFCNTGDDPEGRWLLTTDITGFCRIMDLRESVSSQMFRFGQSFATANTGGFDRLNAGWTIMFLDKRSFQPARSMNSALGMDAYGALPPGKDHTQMWDISSTMKHLPDANDAFIYHRPRKHKPRDGPALDVHSPEDQSVASSTVESRATSVDPSASSELSGDMEIEIDVATDEDGDDDEGGVDIDIEHHEEEEEEESGREMIGEVGEVADDARTVAPWVHDDSSDGDDDATWEVGIVDDDFDPEDEGTEDSTPFSMFYGGSALCGNEPRFARLEDGTLCDDLPCPILHASVRNIYLLQPSNQQVQSGAFMPPMVGLANPLRQPIQHDFEYLRLFERLNMSAQIPALGVVVIASQKGRVLVLSLSKLSAHADHPPGTRDMDKPKTTYGMRVECVLPFASQERENQRPFAPLHGIAVGPMQGYEDVEEERKRWRVMLMYQDHGIMSYEIKRGKEQKCRDSGVDVEGLVV